MPTKSAILTRSEHASVPDGEWPYDGPMTWQDVVEHPALRDLPFKIEQDAWGRILMSPSANVHARRQSRIARLLMEHLGGEAYTEAAIATPAGTRVADVVWMSDEYAERDWEQDVLPTAPPICVEVSSPSNTKAEMLEKITLYLAKGAREVWLCDLEGHVTFFGHEGERAHSALAPDFPSRI